jgi:hypothetical protein
VRVTGKRSTAGKQLHLHYGSTGSKGPKHLFKTEDPAFCFETEAEVDEVDAQFQLKERDFQDLQVSLPCPRPLPSPPR